MLAYFIEVFLLLNQGLCLMTLDCIGEVFRKNCALIKMNFNPRIIFIFDAVLKLRLCNDTMLFMRENSVYFSLYAIIKVN